MVGGEPREKGEENSAKKQISSNRSKRAFFVYLGLSPPFVVRSYRNTANY